MHDNYEYESAGVVCGVNHFVKSDFDSDDMSNESKRVYEDMLDECIIIRC